MGIHEYSTEQQLVLTGPEGVPQETPQANPAALATARAEAGSWAPSARRIYIADWKHFTNWCIENRCPGLPPAPVGVGPYLEHLVEVEGRALATARLCLAG